MRGFTWSSCIPATAMLLVLFYINGGKNMMMEQSRRLFASSSMEPVHVTVFNNGMSTGGIGLTIAPEHVESGEKFAAYLSDQIKVDVFGKKDEKVIADRVFSGTGKLIERFDQLQQGDRLYVVAPGLLFVWPFVKIGHKVFIEATDSPFDRPIILESFTESPRTFYVHNFFSEDEADKLITRVLEIDDENNKLQQSHVGHQSGAKLVSSKRTSENAFDQVSETAVNMRKRSFDLLNIGEFQSDMCDGLQLLRYTQKQAYIPHTDYFGLTTSENFNWDPANDGSNRFATVFLYLSNVTLGGQTVFPLAEMPEDAPEEYRHHDSSKQLTSDEIDKLFSPESWEAKMVRQCQTKLAAYPKKAHAILFYSQKGNGEMDSMSLHGGCPVVEGTKWAANLWVWNRRRFGLDPEESGHGKSTSISVSFENPTDQTVSIYWSGTKMADLAPNGGSQNYKSFHNHKWSFKQGDVTVLEHTIDKDDGAYQTIKVPITESGKADEL